MNRKLKLICMSFDGEYKEERPDFETIEDAWEYSSDLGSKWYFYPFHFVTSGSGKTIVAACQPLGWAEGRRVATVARIFAAFARREETQGMGAEEFAWNVAA